MGVESYAILNDFLALATQHRLLWSKFRMCKAQTRETFIHAKLNFVLVIGQ